MTDHGTSATPPPTALVEVCLATVEDAIVAAAAGAERIELNGALEVGGLTPSWATIRDVRQAWTGPIIVMVRPRPGGFCYDDHTFHTLCGDVLQARSLGADGVAVGMLTAGGAIDVARCRAVVELADGGTVVFHRAFDLVADPAVALEQVIDCGIRRVLTAGGAPTAPAGWQRIRALVRQAGHRIEVLPGGGIRPENVAALVERTGCTQVHGTFGRTVRDDAAEPFAEWRVADGACIAAVRRALGHDAAAASNGTGPCA